MLADAYGNEPIWTLILDFFYFSNSYLKFLSLDVFRTFNSNLLHFK